MRYPTTLHSLAPALALALALVAAGPPPAAATGTARLGNPRMQVLAAKIKPPYSPNFSLSTGFNSWPDSIAGITFLREGQKDSTGLILVDSTFNASPFGFENRGYALANDAGTFLSWALMEDPFTFANHVGVFSYSHWSQSFRKDSADATLRFTITSATLYTLCFTTGSRAEFAMDARGIQGGVPFYSFHQDGGLRMWGNPPGLPTVNKVTHGPMTWTEANLDGIGRDYYMKFNPLTREIDLSGIPLGGEFTISFDDMTQASVAFDEITKAYAYFRDPLDDDSTSVITEIHGLTPTDNPQLGAVAVGPPPPASRAGLSAARPNPASGPVSFTLDLPVGGEVRADVYDLSGRRVAQLAEGWFAAGSHTLTWEPGDGRRAEVSPGVYFVRATGPDLDQVRRVVCVNR